LKKPFITPRLRAALLAAVLACGPWGVAPMAQVRLPALGEAAAVDFSVSTERQVGDQIMRQIRVDPDYMDDPVLLEYLRSVFDPLVAAARRLGNITDEIDTQFAWEPFLVRDRTVNAFALPGGYMGVNLGLIAVTGSSDELAAVLGHELSHVTQRHIARGIANAKETTLLSMAGMILGVLAASRAGSVDGTQAAVVGSQAAAAQQQLNFSRDVEREADRVGFAVLTEAGYSPAGMASMFEKLEAANRMNDTGAFPYLRSHPLTVERISEARARANRGGKPPGDPLEHLLMAARARVLREPGADALRHQQERLNAAPLAGDDASVFDQRLAALYGGALAASMLRESALAQSAVDKALELLRNRVPVPVQALRSVRLLQAQVWLADGKAAQAAKLLASMDEQPVSRPLLLLRAQAALDMWQAKAAGAADGLKQSSEDLLTWVSVHRQDPLAWTALALATDAQGQKLRSLRAQAEARAALGDLPGAIDRLRAAQDLTRSGADNDFIEASVVDARLRDLQTQRRQLEADLRKRQLALAG